MAMSDDTGRDAAFERRVDDYYAGLIRRELEAAHTRLRVKQISDRTLVHPVVVERLLGERPDLFAQDPVPAPWGEHRWSTPEKLAVFVARREAHARGDEVLPEWPPELAYRPDPERPTPVLDRYVERMVEVLFRERRPLSRGELARAISAPYGSVSAVVQGAYPHHKGLFSRVRYEPRGGQRAALFFVSEDEWARRFPGESYPVFPDPAPVPASPVRVQHAEALARVLHDRRVPMTRRDLQAATGLNVKQIDGVFRHHDHRIRGLFQRMPWRLESTAQVFDLAPGVRERLDAGDSPFGVRGVVVDESAP